MYSAKDVIPGIISGSPPDRTIPSKRFRRLSKKAKISVQSVSVGVSGDCSAGFWQNGHRSGQPCRKITAAKRPGKSMVVKGTSPAACIMVFFIVKKRGPICPLVDFYVNRLSTFHRGRHCFQQTKRVRQIRFFSLY